jgi:diguanylate cyclase (GGDEF)-like protein/PAS domain S-box-containing protein
MKKAEDTLRRNEYELRTLVDNSPDLIFRLDRQLRYTYANPAYERLTGILRDQFLGRTNRALGMSSQMIELWQSAAQRVLESGQDHVIEFDMESLFGKRYFYAQLIPEFARSGLVETVLVIARDITERRRAEEQIRYISFHDKVTGLFNRAFFEEEIRRVDTERDLPISIIMGDVNYLKLSNDVFGHTEGDNLLKTIAEAIRKACRQSDIVARWGGDEFAVILPKTDLPTASEIVSRIKQIAADSGGTAVRPGIALGIAAKEQRDQNIYQIIRRSEERMYDNKIAESRQNAENVLSKLMELARERTQDLTRHIDEGYALARRFGRELGLEEDQLKSLLLLIELHDIGTAVVPEGILTKPGRLSEEEWRLVEKHPEAGFRIVKSFPDTARISDEVLSHDEHWDGTGYPRGLKGKEIPYLARVFALIEAYDVMTHRRPYARALSHDEALEELRRNAGSQFDPELAEKFIAFMNQRNPEPALR